MEAKEGLYGEDPCFPVSVKSEPGLGDTAEKKKKKLVIRKRARPFPDSRESPWKKRKPSDLPHPENLNEKQEDLLEIKSCIDSLKRDYNQLQVGMNIVRNQLFKIKSGVEKIASVLGCNINNGY